ncbi:zinc ribbon domain-containing protein [Paenibacillus sp. S-38]|uniref:zinc ribbon domain-containing protein n=1 Tax=Paenibacillus sp. S-38 TaxID=3416710 RepID=UPI003CF1175D
MKLEDAIHEKFKCVKCSGNICYIKEVAMTGTGLSKLFDIQNNHYLFVSCQNCGYVEVYNPRVLEGKSRGQLGTVLDLLFG